MMKSVLVWVGVWVLCGWMAVDVDAQANGGFWWLSSTTNAPPTTTTEPVYCECVAYYLCINGTINTSGIGLLDVRVGGGGERERITNVEKCPDVIDICCGLPTEPPTTSTSTTIGPTLPPDTPCECVSFVNCTDDKLVSDGKGNTTLDILGISGYSHSKCPQALAVCCAVDPGTVPPATVTTEPPASLMRCECVESHLCKEDGYINTDGTGIINIRTRVTPHPNPQGECPSPYVCCLPPPDNSTTTTITPTTTTQPTLVSCGTRNFFGVRARISGFREGESQFGEFPWVVAVLGVEEMMGVSIRRFVGGGTLIHPRVVITAAHKVIGQNTSSLVVRAGEWDTQQELEPYPFQDIYVQEVVIHPRFNPDLLWHDVALLILQEDANIYQPHINTICLATNLRDIDRTACVINGWGLDGFEEGASYQAVMKSLTLPMVNRRPCLNSLRSTRLGRHFNLHNSFVCAGGEKDKDACKGDGGGPLACPRSDDPTRYLLVGITAWGIGCGQDGIPGVYVNVAGHHRWINRQIEARLPQINTTPLTATTTNTTIYDGTLQSGGDINGEILNTGRDATREERQQRRREERQRERQERNQARKEERQRERQDRRERQRGKREENQAQREERRSERQERREVNQAMKVERQQERQERRERREERQEENQVKRMERQEERQERRERREERQRDRQLRQNGLEDVIAE